MSGAAQRVPPAPPVAPPAAPPVVVELPADPTGPALALVVRRLRAAAHRGELVVDLTRTERSSPGVRRALTALRGEARRRGCSWTIRGTLPAGR